MAFVENNICKIVLKIITIIRNFSFKCLLTHILFSNLSFLSISRKFKQEYKYGFLNSKHQMACA